MSEASPDINAGDLLGINPDGTVLKFDPALPGSDQTFIGVARTDSVSMKAAVFYDKSILKRMEMTFGPHCRVCDKIEFNHGMFPDTPNYHPFIKDNCDYLVWKYEQKRGGLTKGNKGDTIRYV